MINQKLKRYLSQYNIIINIKFRIKFWDNEVLRMYIIFFIKTLKRQYHRNICNSIVDNVNFFILITTLGTGFYTNWQPWQNCLKSFEFILRRENY